MKEQSNRYYLKCSNCGFLTEIDNKNHTWCFNCTEQFPIFYKKWQTTNKDKSLADYQKEICISYTHLDEKSIVGKNNAETKIDSPTKDQRIRRTLIKEGRPLDRGGHTEWDFRQFKMYILWMAILFATLFLLTYLLSL